MKTIALASLLVAPFVTGCIVDSSSKDTSLHSANVSTSQMLASFSVQSGDTNVKVYAAVFQKNANGSGVTGITLDPQDSFVVTVDGGAPVTLTHGADDDDQHYSATLPLATADEDITIALTRGNGQVSAPNSFIHLAGPFDMTSPTPSAVKKNSSIPFKLDPVPETTSSSGLKLEAFGPCIADGNNTLENPVVAADGTGSIDTSKITFKDFSTCDVQFYVDVLSVGTIDAAFEGGFGGDGAAQGEQRRAITRTLTP